MNHLPRLWLLPFLLLLLAASGAFAQGIDDDETWAPTPPRLSYIEGEVSYWRPGAEDWVRARPNLALAPGDALYAGPSANLEVQFGSRSFVRADENTQLSLLAQAPQRIQFEVTGGRASFDMRRTTNGGRTEVSTPNAVFVIEHPGYYRVEVGEHETHFITRHGGEATLTTADGRRMAIYPSEEIVITAGNPVLVATYAAAAPDAWDRWNDERSGLIGESVSARYLSPDVYGVEELDHYGYWRVVDTYGPVWIPYDVSAGWVPYSTGTWIWDPYYEWTWIDDAPWGWAPCHYGRWVYIDGYWAWAPGPVVRHPVYAPALVAFMVHGVSARVGIGLPGLWWVALGWGEPLLPWWGPPRHRGHPWWGGWGGPRIVNNVVVKPTTVINAADIHFHNASVPHAILTVPPDKFGRERIRATVENRYRAGEFSPVRGELPVKPTRASLFGGAPKGIQPPRDVASRPVVSPRALRLQAPAWLRETPRVPAQARPESRFVVPPARRAEEGRSPPRPPFGAETGPERGPQPLPPRYDEMKRMPPAPPGAPRGERALPQREPVRPQRAPVLPQREPVRQAAPLRGPGIERREARPPQAPPVRTPEAPRRPGAPSSLPPPRAPTVERPEARPPVVRPPEPLRRPATPAPVPSPRLEAAPPRVQPAAPALAFPPSPGRPAASEGVPMPRSRPEAAPPRGPIRQERQERQETRPLPGQPANQTFRGRERESR